MLSNVRAFFERYFIPETETSDPQHNLQIASAALMVELMFADNHVNAAEQQQLEQLLTTHFELSAEELHDLLEIAHQQKHAATDYYQFTALLNQHYTQAQKIQLIELLWQVAYADDELDKLEEHLIRRLADLLHVPHADFMQAKHRVTG